MEEPDRAAATREHDCTLCSSEHGTTADRDQTSRIPWTKLLLRVFRKEVLLCPCGGRRVVLAFVTVKKVVREIPEHLGLPTTGGRPSRLPGSPLQAKMPLGRMTYRSCSRRCADGGRATLRLCLDFPLRGGG